MSMHRLGLVLMFAIAGTACAQSRAQAAADPLQAPECRHALAALQEQEAAAASAPTAERPADRRGARPADPKLQASRKRAARACLGSRADPPPPAGRFAQPPLAVAPVVGVRPPLAAASASAAISAPPPATAPLTSITSCDAAGCWASDGSRLNRVGPTLWGSRGACSVVGAVVQCP